MSDTDRLRAAADRLQNDIIHRLCNTGHNQEKVDGGFNDALAEHLRSVAADIDASGQLVDPQPRAWQTALTLAATIRSRTAPVTDWSTLPPVELTDEEWAEFAAAGRLLRGERDCAGADPDPLAARLRAAAERLTARAQAAGTDPTEDLRAALLLHTIADHVGFATGIPVTVQQAARAYADSVAAGDPDGPATDEGPGRDR